MALTIGTNISSMQAQRALSENGREINRSSAQIAGGKRIVRAADDAAGLSISETMNSRLRGMGQAKRNASDAVSVVQVAEGGLGEISNMLTRMRELGVQAASDNVGDGERRLINDEVVQLKREINRITKTTRYGNETLLDGTGKNFEFQVDSAGTTGIIGLNSSNITSDTDALGIEGYDFSDKHQARAAIGQLEKSQNMVSGFRSDLGALQNRLHSAGDNLGVAIENVSASKSQISDTDVAASTANYTQNQILQNASVSMLSQANQVPSQALKLLG